MICAQCGKKRHRPKLGKDLKLKKILIDTLRVTVYNRGVPRKL